MGLPRQVGCHALFQQVFLTQESNLSIWQLLHGRKILSFIYFYYLEANYFTIL